MIRWIFRLLVLLAIALPVALALMLWLAVENTPRVVATARASVPDLAATRDKLGAADPRLLAPGTIATIALTPAELTTAANYLLRGVGGIAAATIKDGDLLLTATVPMPVNPIGRYLNVDALMHADGGKPGIARMRIGQLTIPPVIANVLIANTPRWMGAENEAAQVIELVRGMRVANGAVEITYQWDPDTYRRLRAHLIPSEDLERLRVTNELLTRVVRDWKSDLPLTALLRVMIQTAKPAGGNLADENRALLIVLAAFATGKDPGGILPEARNWPRPMPQRLLLRGRDDLAQHFIVSAAIAATAGSAAADAIGLDKELRDTTSGSGFSFADLEADRAGTVFGQRFVDPAHAARLRAAFAGRLRDEDIMPSVAGLPERLTDAEFRALYGEVGSRAYNALLVDIEARIARMPLYR